MADTGAGGVGGGWGEAPNAGAGGVGGGARPARTYKQGEQQQGTRKPEQLGWRWVDGHQA